MSFWNKRKNQAVNAKEYLRQTDRVSRPMAMLTALLAFVVVVSLVVSLFMGGRWLYRQATGPDDNSEQTVAVEQDDGQDSSESVDDDAAGFEKTPADVVDDGAETWVQDSGEQLGVVTPDEPDEEVTTHEVAANNLPRTGAASNIAALIAVVLVSSYGYRQYLISKQ